MLSTGAEALGDAWEAGKRADAPERLRAYLETTDTSSVTHLDLSGEELELESDGWRALLAQTWPALRELRVYDPDCHGGTVARLCESKPKLPVLRTLRLDGFMHAYLDAASCDMLATGGWLEQLETLALVNCQLDGMALRALGIAETKAPPTLQSLDLGTGQYSRNDIGAEGARSIAEGRAFCNLQALNLPFCGIGDAGATALAHSRTLRAVVSLGLFANEIEDAGCMDLCRADALARCSRLDLRGNLVSDRAVDAMCRWHPPELSHLLLGSNPLTDRTAGMLANAPLTGQLEVLDLSNAEIGDEGASALLDRVETERTLRVLDLRHNRLGEPMRKRLWERLGDRIRC